MKVMIGLTKEQIAFAASLADYATDKLKIQHEESYSGVDQLLLSDWIQSAKELAEEFRSHIVIEPVPDDFDFERPEA